MKRLCLVVLLLMVTNSWAANKKEALFTCSGGILPQNSLVKTSTSKEVEVDGSISSESYSKYATTKDKCFKIEDTELVYLIDRDQAIYKVYTPEYFNPWIMIDFNKSPAPTREFKGVVKGVGKYTYKDGKGFPREIPYMIVIK